MEFTAADADELRDIIDQLTAQEGDAIVLWRLRTLYRLITHTDPWPETRR